mgnify:CR=1 FL=1
MCAREPVAERTRPAALAFEMCLLVRSAGAVVRGPHSDLPAAVERPASHDGAVQTEPLPVPVHLILEHEASATEASVFVKGFVRCWLSHAAILARPSDRARMHCNRYSPATATLMRRSLSVHDARRQLVGVIVWPDDRLRSDRPRPTDPSSCPRSRDERSDRDSDRDEKRGPVGRYCEPQRCDESQGTDPENDRRNCVAHG